MYAMELSGVHVGMNVKMLGEGVVRLHTITHNNGGTVRIRATSVNYPHTAGQTFSVDGDYEVVFVGGE